MKKIYLLVFVVLLMLLIPSAVSALGSIAVSSSPAGALVFLDSIDKGVTPLTIDNVTIGAHNVLLMKSGYLNHLSSVTVMDGETVTLSITLTTTSSTPAISSITPSSASNSGSQTVVIAGTNFSGSTVSLTKSGQSTLIGGPIGTDESTTLIRNFNLDGIAPGTWNVEILNVDGGTVTGTFTVNSATTASITSISPTSGLVNTTVSTTIAGTGFVPNSATIRLYRSGNYIIGTVNSGGTATQLTGTFNLNQATPGAYDVCVLPDGTDVSKICSQTFTILSSTSAANGSIYIQSSPTSSKVFLNNVFQGYTPMTLYNLTSGSTPLVTVRSAGYNEWSRNVAVTAGGTTTVTASLVLAPEETTATITTPTPTVTTVKTTAKSTAKVPTPWPSATPTPAASPVSIIAILGAVGVGFIVIRKW